MPPAADWCLADDSLTTCRFACSKEHQRISHFRLHVSGLCSGPLHEQHALQVQCLTVCMLFVQTEVRQLHALQVLAKSSGQHILLDVTCIGRHGEVLAQLSAVSLLCSLQLKHAGKEHACQSSSLDAACLTEPAV